MCYAGISTHVYDIHSVIILHDISSFTCINTETYWVINPDVTRRASQQWDPPAVFCSWGRPAVAFTVPPRLLSSFPRKLSGFFAPATFWVDVTCRDAHLVLW